jgi:hypothetical protein
VIPTIIYFAWSSSTDSTIYGSCMIKEDARYDG